MTHLWATLPTYLDTVQAFHKITNIDEYVSPINRLSICSYQSTFVCVCERCLRCVLLNLPLFVNYLFVIDVFLMCGCLFDSLIAMS